MKTKLLKKFRKKFKIVYHNDCTVLLDLENKETVNFFRDWSCSSKRSAMAYAYRQLLGNKKYWEYQDNHKQRKYRNEQLKYFYQCLNKDEV